MCSPHLPFLVSPSLRRPFLFTSISVRSLFNALDAFDHDLLHTYYGLQRLIRENIWFQVITAAAWPRFSERLLSYPSNSLYFQIILLALLPALVLGAQSAIDWTTCGTTVGDVSQLVRGVCDPGNQPHLFRKWDRVTTIHHRTHLA